MLFHSRIYDIYEKSSRFQISNQSCRVFFVFSLVKQIGFFWQEYFWLMKIWFHFLKFSFKYHGTDYRARWTIKYYLIHQHEFAFPGLLNPGTFDWINFKKWSITEETLKSVMLRKSMVIWFKNFDVACTVTKDSIPLNVIRFQLVPLSP